MGPLFSDYSNMPSFPAPNILAPLMSSCGYTHALCREGGEKATSRRKELLAKWRSQRSCRHATDMRISCGERGVDASSTAFRSPRAAENQFRAPPGVDGRGIVFRNSRISLSAGRRACEPAAKPAIPGAILLRYGFVCYERTPGRAPAGPAPAPARVVDRPRDLRFAPAAPALR
jgi:hypothetical protein